MLRYDIVPDGTVILMEGSGHIDDQHVVDFVYELFHDPRIKPNALVYFDASRINSGMVSEETLALKRRMFSQNPDRLGSMRLAIYAPLEHQFDMAELYLMRITGLPVHARLFADQSIAQLWLGIPVQVI